MFVVKLSWLGLTIRALFSVAIVLMSPGVRPAHAAGTWSPSPHAPELVNGIALVPNLVQGSQTLVVPEGATITLTAWSNDVDTLTDGSATEQVADTPQVVWSVSNNQATLSGERVGSGEAVTVTAPLVPTGETSLTFTVTARPDDDSTEAPGGPLEHGGVEHGGNRNDDPGTGSTITIKVVKECPTTIALTTSCSPSDDDFAAILFHPASQLFTFGDLFTKMTVSGGDPPSPPGNWNGLVIKEAVMVNPGDGGSMDDADFENNAARDLMCTGTAYFIVGGVLPGTTGQTLYGCTFGASDNSFWDHHGANSNLTQRKAGAGAKTVICKQVYSCPKANSDLTPTFTITRSFTNENSVHGRKNKVIITKQ